MTAGWVAFAPPSSAVNARRAHEQVSGLDDLRRVACGSSCIVALGLIDTWQTMELQGSWSSDAAGGTTIFHAILSAIEAGHRKPNTVLSG